MKKIISVIMLCMVVLFGSSFIGASPDPMPAPVPPYTMIDMPDPPTCYALKVELHENNNLQCQYTELSPQYSSIWNMDTFYSVGFTIKVFVKWYSYSSWESMGSMDSNNGDYVTLVYSGGHLSSMTFNYDDLFSS